MQPALARFACRRPFARARGFLYRPVRAAVLAGFCGKNVHSPSKPAREKKLRAARGALFARSLRKPRGRPKIKAAMTANAKRKASVFALLFSDPEPPRELYRARTIRASFCLSLSGGLRVIFWHFVAIEWIFICKCLKAVGKALALSRELIYY